MLETGGVGGISRYGNVYALFNHYGHAFGYVVGAVNFNFSAVSVRKRLFAYYFNSPVE